MLDDELPEDSLGVELFTEGWRPDELSEDDDYAPASGSHHPSRILRIGQDAIAAAARLIGEQVGTVVRETLTGIDRSEFSAATAAGLRPASMQLTFGVKLTAGAGKAIEAVVTAGGEASMQVQVTFDRFE